LSGTIVSEVMATLKADPDLARYTAVLSAFGRFFLYFFFFCFYDCGVCTCFIFALLLLHTFTRFSRFASQYVNSLVEKGIEDKTILTKNFDVELWNRRHSLPTEAITASGIHILYFKKKKTVKILMHLSTVTRKKAGLA
jgi:hypothetical protein